MDFEKTIQTLRTPVACLVLMLVLGPGCPHDVTRRSWEAGARPDSANGDIRTGDSGLDTVPGGDGHVLDVAADLPALHDLLADGDAPLPETGADLLLPTDAPVDLVPSADMVAWPDSGPLCGNGKIDKGEQCDGKLLGGQTCKTKSFDGGVLKCKSCVHDTGGCHQVLDPGGKMISATAGDDRYVAVGHDKTNFLVAWQTRLSASKTETTRVARYSTTGILLDKAGVDLHTSALYKGKPSVAFDGANYLVVWSNALAADDFVTGARVSPKGLKLGTSLISVSRDKTRARKPDLVFDGANHLVVWTHELSSGGLSWDLHGARVTPGGKLLGKKDTVINNQTGKQEWPSVACGTGNCLVVWHDLRGGVYGIYGARISKAGSVLDSAGFKIAKVSGGKQWGQLQPSVAWGDGVYLVVWADYRKANWDIYGSRVTAQGVVMDAQGIVISSAAGSQYYPAVAFNGVSFLAVWQDTRNTNSDIYGARIMPTGTPTAATKAGIAISTHKSTQQFPEVACIGSACLVVWQDFRSNKSFDIYGARVQ